jgi:hypothetical protein
MYRVPTQDEPVLFGDVFSSEWLFDAVLSRDAVPLREVNLRGGARGYAPVTACGPSTSGDLLLAHGNSCRAILISDDFEVETCLIRREGRGRLVFAAVAPWPEDHASADKAMRMTTFRRHPLEPADGFAGGIVEFFRLFAVTGTALLDKRNRVVALNEDARARLEQRWAAFATRRGPLAAADNATKLAHVLDARGATERFTLLLEGDALPTERVQDAAKAVARTFVQAWRTEGEIMQKIADAHEARTAGAEAISALAGELQTLSGFAAEATELLQRAAELP